MADQMFLSKEQQQIVQSTLEEFGEQNINDDVLVRFLNEEKVSLDGYLSLNQLQCIKTILERLHAHPASATPIGD